MREIFSQIFIHFIGRQSCCFNVIWAAIKRLLKDEKLKDVMRDSQSATQSKKGVKVHPEGRGLGNRKFKL
jgi:hypothetical protein